MPDFRRYAIYDPGPAPLAEFGVAWLGWDAARGHEIPPLAPPAVVATPRRYGFHATIKAPFRMAERCTPDDLRAALRDLAATLAPVSVPGGLHLRRLGDFIALVPDPQPAALTGLAAQVVEALDRFRAPLSAQERARRHPGRLSPAERQNLDRWGYPHVMDRFRYHMTLTGPLSDTDAAPVMAELRNRLHGLLPVPHPVGTLALMGEDADGRFHVVERVPLAG